MRNNEHPLKLSSRLDKGAMLGVAAPSSPFERISFERGIAVLKAQGFRVHLDPDLFCRRGFLAGSDRRRAATINRLFANPEIDAIICARGGYGAMRILQFIDVETVKANPKPIMGFSDATALLTFLYKECGLIVFHGPVVTSMSDLSADSLAAVGALLTSSKPYHLPFRNAEILRAGSAKGKVWGGNLTTLCHLLGTPYVSRFKGHILIIEDNGEAPYRVDRMLTHLRLAGAFEALSGLVIGSFSECGCAETLIQIFREQFCSAPFPVIRTDNIGHTKHNLAFPIGPKAILDTKRKRLSFIDPIHA